MVAHEFVPDDQIDYQLDHDVSLDETERIGI